MNDRSDQTSRSTLRRLAHGLFAWSGREEPATVVLILGMHRSGTSALTRVLSLCGGDLPANLCPAVAGDNDLGYWESLPLVALHERLFRESGTCMLDPNPIDPAWFRASDAARAARRLRDLLEREFAGKRCWLVKEPRMCRFMPLWRMALADTPHRLCAVMPIRDPVEVAASLARRGGIDRRDALRSWVQHVVAAERYTRDLPRCFTAYDGLMSSWRPTVARIADVVPDGAIDAQRGETAVDAFLTPELRHHRAAREVPLDAEFEPVRTAFLQAARDDIAPDPALADDAWRRLELRRAQYLP